MGDVPCPLSCLQVRSEALYAEGSCTHGSAGGRSRRVVATRTIGIVATEERLTEERRSIAAGREGKARGGGRRRRS